jgi:hypothetical protein
VSFGGKTIKRGREKIIKIGEKCETKWSKDKGKIEAASVE